MIQSVQVNVSYLRGYVLILGVATCLLTAVSLLRIVDVPPLPAPAPPALGASLVGVNEVPQRVRVLDYEREQFGNGWSPTAYRGCDTREVMLLSVVPGTGCQANGVAVDPYTGEELVIGAAGDPVEIDHVFPLSAAWDLGAHSWSFSQRLAFSNDPRNLVVTSRSANQEKSDALPAAWLPEHPGSRCWYARRLADVAAVYGLALPTEDVAVMKRQCRLREIWPS